MRESPQAQLGEGLHSPSRATEPHPVETLQERINDLFEHMWLTIGKQHHGFSGRAYSGPPPRTDLAEAEKHVELAIELPGMDEDDIELLVADDRLTVRGEKKMARQEKGRNYILTERSYGRFERSYRLPPDLDSAKTEARLEKGVLSITIPKKPAAKRSAKKIPVKGK